MRKILFSLFLLLCTTATKAQTKAFQPEYYVGINGGTTFSSMRFQPAIKQEMKMGMRTGGTFRYISEKHFGVQVELNYAQYGWKEVPTIQYPKLYERTLNYLELPFLSHIYFNIKKTRIFFNLGPEIALFLNDSEKSEYAPDETRGYGKKIENKFNYGICGGMGFEYRSKIGSFGIEGRYFFSLGDVFNNSKKDPFEASAPQVISASVYYLLPVGKK